MTDIITKIKMEDLKAIAEICFYCLTGILAVLTYLSAKRVLLNTVNTEYQKKVIIRLEDLSKILADEFYMHSEKYWVKNDTYLITQIKTINEMYAGNPDSLLNEDELTLESNPQASYLLALENEIKADPFVPKRIREAIIDNIIKRAYTIDAIYHSHLSQYASELAHGKADRSFEENYRRLEDSISKELVLKNCGILQIEDEVNYIRLYIQEYFESFRPIKKRYKKYVPVYKKNNTIFSRLKRLFAVLKKSYPV